MVYNFKNDFDVNFGSHKQVTLEHPWFWHLYQSLVKIRYMILKINQLK